MYIKKYFGRHALQTDVHGEDVIGCVRKAAYLQTCRWGLQTKNPDRNVFNIRLSEKEVDFF